LNKTGTNILITEDRPLSYILTEIQIDSIEKVLKENIIDLGVNCVFIIDMAGNVISDLDDGKKKHDIYSLAALAAGNFSAVNAMAKIIGESEFSLLFHKGETENIHFSKVMDGFLMVIIFDNNVSLGFLRLKVAEAIKKLKKILSSSDIEK
jgi:predicted regulator of Ras-like GTPase activity (Roadblock/LC7/MglB family)